MNVMQNNLQRYLLQLNSFNHLSSIQQALKILNFKHLIYKYKIGFVSQLNAFEISHKVFKHILKDNKKQHNSSSYVNDINIISNFLLISKDDFGRKAVVISQLKLLNEKFDKRPECVPLVKFCLENYKETEFVNYLKKITRSENFDLNSVENLNYIY